MTARDRAVQAARRYKDRDPEIDAVVEKVMGEIDQDAFRDLAARYQHLPPHPGPGKYLELPNWLARHVVHARALGLLEGPPRRILDLGTGNGYFPFLCTCFGHRVVAVDVDTSALFNDLVSLLGIDRRVLRIQARERLRDLGGPFDLVTAFNISFNANNTPEMWEVAEWRFFLHDLATRHLEPAGEIFLKLNPMRKPGGYDAKPLLDFFETSGGEVEYPFVHYRDLSRLRQNPESS